MARLLVTFSFYPTSHDRSTPLRSIRLPLVVLIDDPHEP
jgi:hypothetical protein